MPSQALSKDRSLLSPPHTPHTGVPLLAGNNSSPNVPSSAMSDHVNEDSGASAFGHAEKLQEEQASSARVSAMSSGLSSSLPGAARPSPNAPASNPSGILASISGPTDETRSSLADSGATGSSPSRAASMSPAVRMVRHSRDAGIRLAGGPLGEANSEMWPPGEYDDVETLPPSYAHIHGP